MHWVRLELQCRPTKLQRAVAAQTDLVDFWGFSRWSAKVADDIFNLDVPRVNQVDWRDKSDAEVLKWVGKQYGKLFQRRFSELGSWENVGVELGNYVLHKLQQIEDDSKG